VTTTSDTTPPVNRSLRRIGLWGAPQSGKTTFLAALNVAVTQSTTDLVIFGIDDDATQFLAENTSMLVRRRRFPEATQVSRPLAWALNMPTQRMVPGRFGRFSRQVSQPTTLQFNVDLIDAPGDFYAATPNAGGRAEVDADDLFGAEAAMPEEPQEVIEHLADCDGIVYLFDPIREFAEGDAYDYFQGTLLRVAQRRLGTQSAGAKLPQHLAVCVTKLDSPAVYRRARRGGFLTFADDDPYLFPRVREDRAAEFFAEICQSALGGTADLVPGAIKKFFAPDRVKYFATSAIGFHLRPGASRFIESDYQNAVEGADGTRIRGRIRPVNVVEPLVWLGERLAATDRRA